ncbi:MAG: L-histidine N(alpha)-methyltransferase [Pseudomonadota bacterium]
MSQSPALATYELLDHHPTDDDLEAEILRGLSAPQKALPPKLFYDKRGSLLFEDICELPEYYPTRVESQIMVNCIDELVQYIGPEASLIEFGSGASAKTRILLDSLQDLAAYVPVEISRAHLKDVSKTLQQDYPGLDIRPVCADFTKPFKLPSPTIPPLRNIVYFPGSTIGNFDLDDAIGLLRVMRQIAGVGGGLLIGVDLKKDKGILEAAYNDAQGVTADFNMNMLIRLNREFDANFDLETFHHQAPYLEDQGRIEMHLVSDREQQVSVAGETFAFGKGESIHTESSHKYDLAEFADIAGFADFRVEQVWTDPDNLFSVQYFV